MKHRQPVSCLHRARLTKEPNLDMYWWLNFLPQWNGTCCILQTVNEQLHQAMDLYTDASGTHGLGAYWSPWLADGSMHNGQQSMPIKTLHGKNFMPLPQQLTHRATFGKGRKFYSITTTSRFVIYGKRGLLGNRRS